MTLDDKICKIITLDEQELNDLHFDLMGLFNETVDLSEDEAEDDAAIFPTLRALLELISPEVSGEEDKEYEGMEATT